MNSFCSYLLPLSYFTLTLLVQKYTICSFLRLNRVDLWNDQEIMNIKSVKCWKIFIPKVQYVQCILEAFKNLNTRPDTPQHYFTANLCGPVGHTAAWVLKVKLLSSPKTVRRFHSWLQWKSETLTTELPRST